MSTDLPEEVCPDGTPDDVPTKSPDAELRLTDEGLEMPAFLQGYTGEFTIRTPSVTGEFETAADGLPTGEFWDGIIAVYPDAGDWHGDLREGLMGISTETHRETVFEIIDERSDDQDGDRDA